MQLRVLGRFAMGRMNKNRCFAPIELVEDGIEQRIPQVTVIYTGKETHAIEVQDIEGIRDFFQSSVYVRQGKESEGAESRRMFRVLVCLELVARPGHFPQSTQILQDHPRRQRGYGCSDFPTIHRLQFDFDIRNFYRHRVVGVLRRHHVVMHVNAPISWSILAHTFVARVQFRPGAEESLYIISIAP